MNENGIGQICFLLFFRIGAFQGVASDSSAFFWSCLRIYSTCLKAISISLPAIAAAPFRHGQNNMVSVFLEEIL